MSAVLWNPSDDDQWDEEAFDEAQQQLIDEWQDEQENGGWSPDDGDEGWESDEEWTDWSRP